MATCLICNSTFKVVTNTHLSSAHGISLEDYRSMFPDAILTDASVTEKRAEASKGLTYEERYGEEKAAELRTRRKHDALLQFSDVQQRVIRRKKAWKGCGNLSGDKYRVYRQGAEKRNLEFTVTVEYLWELFVKQGGKCALTGLDIVLDARLGSLNKTGFQKSDASLDRIDNTKGYIEGNLQWVHKDINRMKSDFTLKTFLEYCLLVTSTAQEGKCRG